MKYKIERMEINYTLYFFALLRKTVTVPCVREWRSMKGIDKQQENIPDVSYFHICNIENENSDINKFY